MKNFHFSLGSIALIINLSFPPSFSLSLLLIHSHTTMSPLSRLFGHATTTFHSHPAPLSLPLEPPNSSPTNPTSDNPTTTTTSSSSLLTFCQKVTPPCNLNPLLFNGHLQTFWTAIGRSYDIPIYYKRWIFEAEEERFRGEFCVDFVVRKGDADGKGAKEGLPPRTSYYTNEEFESLGSPDDTRPMLITLHGLSGGSHEIYLRHVLWPMVQEEKGWEACVVNSRGCAKSRITSGVLYNARATWDIRQVVKWCRRRWPKRPLFGIGYSLGANILVNVRLCFVDRFQCDYCGSDFEILLV